MNYEILQNNKRLPLKMIKKNTHIHIFKKRTFFATITYVKNSFKQGFKSFGFVKNCDPLWKFKNN